MSKLLIGLFASLSLSCAIDGNYSEVRRIAERVCVEVGCPQAYAELQEECMEMEELDKRTVCMGLAKVGFEECPGICKGIRKSE
jgi:hypothetical protein